MGDLISRSRLLDSMHREDTRLIGGNHHIRLSAVQEKIRIEPTVDAVEVVRCRECKNRGEYLFCPMVFQEWYHDCDGDGFYVIDNTRDDGFCHKGAKMDGGANDELR